MLGLRVGVQMQKIKILILTIILFVGFVFNGELYMLYLNNFQECYYQAGFALEHLPKETSDDEIINDFIDTGEEYDVDFFVVDKKIRTANATEYTIYGTEYALQYLQLHDIKEGKNKSLFFGEATIYYEAYSKIEDIVNYDTYYFIGDETNENDFRSFKAALVGQYGGGFPKKLGSDQETWLNLLSVWGNIFLLALIMTLYGVVYQKKETMVRIILGENLTTLLVKNIMVDTGSFLLLFLLIPRFLYRYSNVYFKLSFIVLLFTIFLSINILLNASILNVKFKKDLAGGNDGQVLLIANYALKVITTILAIIILASNVVTIRDAYNLYKQRGFFETHKNYSYYQLNYIINNNLGKSFDDNTSMNQSFYQKFQSRSLQYVDLTESMRGNYPVLLSNRTAMEEIKSNWPSIAAVLPKATDEKVYLFLPSKLSSGSDEYQNGMDIGNVFFEEAGYGKIDTIVYDNDISIIGIHKYKDYQMKLYESPIILFNNTVFQTNELLEGYHPYYNYDTMFDISPEELQIFVQEYQLSDQIVAKSNVLDIYESEWSKVYRNLEFTLLLSVIVIFLEITLILFILRLEYQFNAIEMALKKIHGYSLLSRNKRILKVTIFSSLVGILAALIISYASGMQGGYPLILVGLLLLVLELCYILQRANKTEKLSIVSILKGEKI